jgi:hypothetical protein
MTTGASSVQEEEPDSAEAVSGNQAVFWDPPIVGETHRSTGAKVDTIVLRTPKCWVFLDDKLTTWWACAGLPQGNETVLNRVAVLEAIPIDSLSVDKRTVFRGLVAEGVARMLDGGDIAAANAIHQAAEDYVRGRLSEVARSWYLRAALQALLSAFALMAVSGLLPDAFYGQHGHVRLLVLCLGCGAIGAASSLISRIGSFPLDPSAGRALHQQEAVARVSAGVVGALVAYLAVQGGFILPSLSSSNPGLFLLSFVAGASERFVPSIVERIEASAAGRESR